MKKVLFVIMLFVGLFLLIGNVYALGDIEYNEYGGDGGDANVLNAPITTSAAAANAVAGSQATSISGAVSGSVSGAVAMGDVTTEVKVEGDTYINKTPIDTPQMPSQQPMPIIQNGKIFPYPDMPDFDGIKPYDKAKENVVNVKVVTWKWNIADTFAFSWITYTNAIETIIEEFNKSEKQADFRFSVMCLDGSWGYGSQGGLVGSLLDGIGGASGGLFPGINRSDYDPKCPVKIYQVVNKK